MKNYLPDIKKAITFRNINFHLLKMIPGILFLIFSFQTTAQSPCPTGTCGAKDFKLDNFFLGDADTLAFTTIPGADTGDKVDAYIWASFTATTAANRYSLLIQFDLYIDGVLDSVVNTCLFSGEPIPVNVPWNVAQIEWEYGAKVEIKNFYASWQ